MQLLSTDGCECSTCSMKSEFSEFDFRIGISSPLYQSLQNFDGFFCQATLFHFGGRKLFNLSLGLEFPVVNIVEHSENN